MLMGISDAMCISYINHFNEKQKIQLPIFGFKKNGVEI